MCLILMLMALPDLFSDHICRSTSGTSIYPSMQYILNNANVPPNTTSGFLTGEILPAITRTMNFQVIVRDNRRGGGGVNTSTSFVNVDGTSGPFVITLPETAVSWIGNSTQTVTWDVAGPPMPPCQCSKRQDFAFHRRRQHFPDCPSGINAKRWQSDNYSSEY